MNNLVKTSCDNKGLVIENASQRVNGEVAEALAARRSAHLADLAITQETDLTPELRRQSSELRRRSTQTMNGSGDDFARLEVDLRDAAFKRSELISSVLKDRIKRREQLAVTDLVKWSEHIAVEPLDHSFWWAQTQPHVAPDTHADFRDDGLHFWGGPKVNNYDGEMHTSFGAVASFALQPDRFPKSANGLFLSSPHVELFGGITAYAPDWDLIQGNGIAECKLFLRQTIFQLGFGPFGPVPRIIAEAKRHDEWQMYLRNTGYSRNGKLPGFKLIPAVTYNQNQLPPNELFAEIEVRFDIYLNCTGALAWCDPDVLLRTFQWAPTPLP